MEIFLIIGVLLVVAVAAHEYRLKRFSDKMKREGKEAADYAGLPLLFGLGAHLHDRPHDAPHDPAGHADHMDHMDTGGGGGDGMGGE
ncbi:MAG: hypothetical protein ACE5GT_04300 [Rhodospirillales bacterium]